MNPSKQQADALRLAADAIETAAAANAEAAKAQAEAIEKNASAQVALAAASVEPVTPVVAEPKITETKSVTPVTNSGHSDSFGEKGGKNFGFSNGVTAAPASTKDSCRFCAAIWAIAGILLVVPLIAWLVWLTASKPSNERVDAVHAVATSANATANEAKASAASVSEKVKALKSDVATAVATANSAKADASASKADAAAAMAKAQAAADAIYTHRHRVIAERAPRKPPVSRDPGPVSRDPGPASGGKVWLWHEPGASDENPKACVLASGSGSGLPKRCNSFTVKPSNPGETKCKWMERISGNPQCESTGVYTKPGVHF